MDWRAASDQRAGAALCVFYMLVSMFMMTIQAGRDSRLSFRLGRRAPWDAPMAEDTPSTSNADFYHRVFGLLAAIHVAAYRLMGMITRAIYELMNHAYALARSTRERACMPAAQCVRTVGRLDSS